MSSLRGVWLPIVTPFSDNKIDYKSYKKLIDYYTPKGITGLIPNGTTGECPTLEDYEFEELLEKTVEFNNNRLPIYYGLGGNYTNKVLKQLKVVEKYKIDGILSVSPYYSRPDQKGIFEHFKTISDSTDLKIIIYNIPYRTGRNIENDTLFKLSEFHNIVGVKDSCADINQTIDLLFNRSDNFSVLTGDDILFYLTLALGGDGGIIAASHLETEKFVSVIDSIDKNDQRTALATWKTIEKFIPLLFKEPNPAPIKYYLAKKGLINSDELRLPLTGISDKLKQELDKYL
ncbi:MAG: 4-hydroxy-tetrahydrodipicolinate synthase [bacterium]|nr:4-hydroxy-tetrahydrodipicolinate synthase [bacterium]